MKSLRNGSTRRAAEIRMIIKIGMIIQTGQRGRSQRGALKNYLESGVCDISFCFLWYNILYG